MKKELCVLSESPSLSLFVYGESFAIVNAGWRLSPYSRKFYNDHKIFLEGGLNDSPNI